MRALERCVLTGDVAVMGNKILLVEDNADFQEIFGRMAAHLGFEVICAENGLEGIRKATAEKPDGVVVDLVLTGTGGMDGIETIRRLKRDRTTQRIPIIVCTALIDELSESAALRAGAAEYLRKPVGVSALESTLRRYLT